MQDGQPSRTAEINAAQRAAETLRDPGERLFEDPFARHFVRRRFFRGMVSSPPVARASLRYIDWRFPGLNAVILLRAEYARRVVAAAASEGITQLVLMGAGYDSTALRAEADGLTVFEVDAPATQDIKRLCLEQSGLTPRGRVVFVPCDFEHDSPARLLDEAGFDRSERSLAVWLGVSYYLTREAFDATVSELGQIGSAGSRLVLDYMDPAVPDGSTTSVGPRRMARDVERRGEPYRTGFEPGEIAERLREAGFGVTDDVGMVELARRFRGDRGAWCRTDDFVHILTAERLP